MTLPPVRSRRGYPLGMLFVLLAVCAILSAMAAPVLRSSVLEPESIQFGPAYVGASTLLAIFLGGIIGLYHHRRLLGFFVGGLVGIPVGFFGGVISAANAKDSLAIFSASLVGSLVVVATGFIMYWQSESNENNVSRTPPSRPTDHGNIQEKSVTLPDATRKPHPPSQN